MSLKIVVHQLQVSENVVLLAKIIPDPVQLFQSRQPVVYLDLLYNQNEVQQRGFLSVILPDFGRFSRDPPPYFGGDQFGLLMNPPTLLVGD